MFDALEVSLEMVRELRGSLAEIRTRDRDLYLQMRRAAASIPLNLAEGRAKTAFTTGALLVAAPRNSSPLSESLMRSGTST